MKVESDPRKFIFRYETDGALSAKKALTKALDILHLKFNEFEKQLDRLEIESSA